MLFLRFVAAHGPASGADLTTLGNFLIHPLAALMFIALLGVAITGGMFVVPLYAFLTTTVPEDRAARTVAANNIVNSGAMVGNRCWPLRSICWESDRATSCCWCGDVSHFRLARLEAPPRLRLSYFSSSTTGPDTGSVTLPSSPIFSMYRGTNPVLRSCSAGPRRGCPCRPTRR